MDIKALVLLSRRVLLSQEGRRVILLFEFLLDT